MLKSIHTFRFRTASETAQTPPRQHREIQVPLCSNRCLGQLNPDGASESRTAPKIRALRLTRCLLAVRFYFKTTPCAHIWDQFDRRKQPPRGLFDWGAEEEWFSVFLDGNLNQEYLRPKKNWKPIVPLMNSTLLRLFVASISSVRLPKFRPCFASTFVSFPPPPLSPSPPLFALFSFSFYFPAC